MTAQDLTAIEKPFGLLDAETQAALQAHRGPHEVYTYEGWKIVDRNVWANGATYRIRPATKPSIDWSHVAEGFNWLAVGKGGQATVYQSRPRCGSWHWGGDLGLSRSVCAFASYTPGTCDWKDSLVCRPGYEGDAA